MNEKPIYMHGETDGIDVEIALQWNDGYAETIYTFANNINTHEGGTHLSGFRAALTRTVNHYASKNNLAKDLKESGHRRRHPRGPDGRHQRQDSAAAVRGPDQDQARQHRGEGHRRGGPQRQAGRVSRGEPAGRAQDRRQGHRRRARARSGPQGARSGAAQGRPRRQLTARASWPTARSATPHSASCTSSRASRPAARPSRAAIGASRRSCRSRARSSTSRRRASTRCWAATRSRR